MAQQSVPKEPTPLVTQYRMLYGVDYQKDVTDVDKKRSPDMVNMISDLGGNPIKRDGFRVVGQAIISLCVSNSKMYAVRKLYNDYITVSEVEMTDYELETVQSTTIPYAAGAVNKVFGYQHFVFVLCEKVFIRFDTDDNTYLVSGTTDGAMSTGALGETAPTTPSIIPLTVIAITDPETGNGGSALYGKNLLSIYQQVNYIGDGTKVIYKIPGYTKVGTYLKVEVMDANGEWQVSNDYTVGAATQYTGKSLDGTDTIESNVIDGTITFNTAPSAPVVAGNPNVRITFAPYSLDQIDGVNKGYYNETFAAAMKSEVYTMFSSRLFVAVGEKSYYSDASSPFSISDNSWFEVDNTIVAYTKTSSYLAVITKDTGVNTIFLASETTKTVDSTTGETETYFSIKPSNAGIGAVSNKCVGTLNDEPMFLSHTGIYGIQTNWASEKYALNRSARINRRLCKEDNLEDAVGIPYNGYFYIALNGHMYVLDGRHRDNSREGEKSYECYYFSNIPVITEMCVINNKMYWSDGTNTYTWNDDLPDTAKYYDYAYRKEAISIMYQLGESNTEAPTGEWSAVRPEVPDGYYLWLQVTYDDDSVEVTINDGIEIGYKEWTGEIVTCRWASAFDDDGSPQMLKTLNKKGTMVTVVPHYRSSVEVTLVKDGDEFEYIGIFETDMFSFEQIDFTRFTFSSNTVAADVFPKKKIKKYKRLQIILENNRAEPFGITNVVKTYTVGNYAKR